MVQVVLIPFQSCHIQRREGLESPLLSTTLIRDKYLLHIINEIISMVSPLRDYVYIYEYREIITLI